MRQIRLGETFGSIEIGFQSCQGKPGEITSGKNLAYSLGKVKVYPVNKKEGTDYPEPIYLAKFEVGKIVKPSVETWFTFARLRTNWEDFQQVGKAVGAWLKCIFHF